MQRFGFSSFFILLCCLQAQVLHDQGTQDSRLIWKVNKLDLGAILEEEGIQVATFEFSHSQDSAVWIEKVWTDCGCTTVEYTQDSLSAGEVGMLKVAFDPGSAVGGFSRLVVVKGNLANMMDTLYLEGKAVPKPRNPEVEYPFVSGPVGMRQEKTNMGDVFTNEPAFKALEIFNFSDSVLRADSLRYFGPGHIQIRQIQDSIAPGKRGILEISYDGAAKNDLGYSEDPIQFFWSDSLLADTDVIANIFEFYPGFAKDELGSVPAMRISPTEIDLKEISADEIQELTYTLTNRGRELLEIKKVQGNCGCLSLTLPKTELAPGESMDLIVTFDPKGRRGIDQRNIYIFTNDPLNPVQSVILKSRIE
ncbi:DUF1573 domain-containing protein [Algoriphagus sp. NF]|uniref:DUF1573 domain-containing protein n=1 Tax=Algoriphagus sp. NF TaxID=2992756 RepID=UPI00237A9FEC|nr:DUF1573 domain-containing protein [Algoriphagus sp. NF]MDE0560809.1 DUF1573 domain-containing protein [Algoriphagus sp. NF]